MYGVLTVPDRIFIGCLMACYIDVIAVAKA
jgi:hypothetical protein